MANQIISKSNAHLLLLLMFIESATLSLLISPTQRRISELRSYFHSKQHCNYPATSRQTRFRTSARCPFANARACVRSMSESNAPFIPIMAALRVSVWCIMKMPLANFHRHAPYKSRLIKCANIYSLRRHMHTRHQSTRFECAFAHAPASVNTTPPHHHTQQTHTAHDAMHGRRSCTLESVRRRF